MKKPAIIAVVIIFLLAAASVTAIIIYGQQRTERPLAVIKSGGETLYTIDLSQVSQPYRITVSDDSGGFNEIEVRQGEIGVISADCPDKTCVNMGFAESGSDRIICVPHRLEIYIENAGATDGVSR